MEKDAPEEVLVYDIHSQANSSENTETPPERPPQLLPMPLADEVQTRVIKVRSQGSTGSPVVSSPKEQQPPESIIFYEQEEGGLGGTVLSMEWEESNRALIKHEVSSEEEYDEEQRDKLHQLQPARGQRRRVVPPQRRQAEGVVVVRAKGRQLVCQPVPLSYKLTCWVEIERNILGIATRFILYLGGEKQFLLAAKKQALKYYSNFLISAHPDHIHKRTQHYMGRLQANFVGTEFRFYRQVQEVELLDMTVSYETNFAGIQGPRQFAAVKIDPRAKHIHGRDLAGVAFSNQKSKLTVMKTACPALQRGKYRLDFKGKARKPSAKNFILEQEGRQCLLFGKVKQNLFVAEVSYPLTLLQAFGVCLASLDSKLLAN